jgi:phosphatidylserine decarboxylase
MPNALPLRVYDRRSGDIFSEFMDDSPATYAIDPYKSLVNRLQSHPLFDWFVARYQDTSFSARKIGPFVKKHKIDLEEFEPGPFRSYAEFFDRRFRPRARAFPADQRCMGAFAEARYFGWEQIGADQTFPIKGNSLNAATLLDGFAGGERFLGGPVLLARLAPVDYHRLHYPDAGVTLDETKRGRHLWTINQHALRARPDIPLKNERRIQILHTANFGRLAFVEFGALSVGRIVQTHPSDRPFRRGEEKSQFRFGGSAVVVIGERGRWTPCNDILQHTRDGVEVYVRLGEPIAGKIERPDVSKLSTQFRSMPGFSHKSRCRALNEPSVCSQPIRSMVADGGRMDSACRLQPMRWSTSRWDRTDDPERGKYPAYQQNQRAFNDRD